MNDVSVDGQGQTSARRALLDALAQGDRAVAATPSVLRHLLSGEDCGLLSDEIVAKIRGMLDDMAGQLLFALADAAKLDDAAMFVDGHREEMVDSLAADTGLLGHLHALALESRLTDELATVGVDPMVPPVVQDLMAGGDHERAALAMALMAAQARFAQQSRRMELPLAELPGDLFHRALQVLQSLGGEQVEAAKTARKRLRKSYDEGHARVGILTRIGLLLEPEMPALLTIQQAGPGLFLTALAMASDQERELVVLAAASRQPARFALSLRAAGLDDRALAAQFLYFHPDAELPQSCSSASASEAAVLLRGTRA